MTATQTRARLPEVAPARPARRAVLGWGMVGLGMAVAVNSLLGPLALDTIDYPVSESMRNQTIGLDLANLAMVAPLAALTGVLALRGNAMAPLLALGPTTYAAYMFAQYVAGPDHLVYPRALLLQLGVFVAGWVLAAVAWVELQARSVEVWSPRHGYVLLGLAVFVLLRYLPGLAASVGERALPAEVATDPAMYWLIVLMDLGIFVPLALGAGWAVVRGSTRAWHVLRGAVAWFALTTVAVACMSATMLVNDDPNAAAAQLGLFVVVGVVVIAYAVWLHRDAAGPGRR